MSTIARLVAPAPPEPVTLVVSGEVDLATAPNLSEQLRAATVAAEGRELYVDLSAVPFMDSAGVDPLLEARERAGGRMSLRKPPKSLLRILDVLGLTTCFTFIEERPAAAGSYREGGQGRRPQPFDPLGLWPTGAASPYPYRWPSHAET